MTTRMMAGANCQTELLRFSQASGFYITWRNSFNLLNVSCLDLDVYLEDLQFLEVYVRFCDLLL